MRVFFAIAVIVLYSICGNCQALKREHVTKKDKMNGVFLKFNYSAKDSYGVINLILKKDNTYSYSVNTFATHKISEGKWKMVKDLLVLESTFQMDNVPAEISYEKNAKFVDSFDIAVVQNFKGELLMDAFVLINNDTIKCLPMIGKCNASFERIDSVKVVFENGMSSKWITVKSDERKIGLTVLTDASIGNYLVMNKRKFKLNGNYLRQQ